jgi:hypothetical protein
MQSTYLLTIRTLRNEAKDLRAWADATLPERARVEPYMLAARLERMATEMAAEPVWRRVGADVRASTQAFLQNAQRGFRRSVS